MKKLIFLLCMGASIANGVGVNNEISSDFLEFENKMSVVNTDTSKSPTIEEIIKNKEPELKKDSSYYVLNKNFAYYKGSKPMRDITRIVFTNTAPKSYDEKWYANEKKTEDVVGYRKGTEVYIVGEHIYLNPYSNYMFAAQNSEGSPLWKNLISIEGLNFVNTSKVRSTMLMFYKNLNIKELDLNMWDMSNVETTSFMFAGCLNLEKLYIDRWDVGKVKDFSAMFQGTSHKGDMKLKYLDVSKWDTSSAENMGHIFYGCANLEYIDVSNWDVRKVFNFSHMFSDCFKLKELDLSKWETLSVVSFDAFLNDCRSLIVIDVSNLETSTCMQFSQMFEACVNLEKIIGIENWDVSNASHYAFSETFHCCYKLKELNLSSWKTEKADNYARMFAECRSLTELDLSNFGYSNLKFVTEMFKGCVNLKDIKGIDTWVLNNVKGSDSMY